MLKKILWGLCFAFACASTADNTLPAATKNRITHEELWNLKRVGAPSPSPDGKWVVFAVTAPAYDAKDQNADLWIVPFDGRSPARQLTQTKAPESGVSWSPDALRIAFSSKREGDDAAQIYVMNLGGGEAERLTNLSLGARQPKWSPDGLRLLFVSDAFPGCADEEAIRKAIKERKERKYNARVYESFPIRYWDHWLDDKKAHLFVQEAHPGAPSRDLFAGTQFAESPAFGPQNTDEGQSIEAEWSPDGQNVVFVEAVNRDDAARTAVRTQIFSVPATGGEPRNLTNDQYSYEQLTFAPDGRTLFCGTSEGRADKVYEHTRLASFPWPIVAGGRRVLTAAFDRSVGRFAAPASSDRLWFSAEDAGLEKLYSVAYTGGDVREERIMASGCFTGLAAGGSVLAANWETATNPPEVFALKGSGKAPLRLTSFNTDKAAAFDLAPVEHFWFTSRRGKPIHSMLVRPPAFDPDKQYPLFVVIHGGAANMWRDSWGLRWNYHLLGAPGYVVLLTDYTGSTGYGEKFSQDIQFDPLKGPADEINEAADEALKKYPFIDASRLAAGGASYGGHLANWLQATTARFKCIVSHAGEADLAMQWGTSDSIFHREVNSGTPIWGDSKVWRDQSAVLQGHNHDTGTGFVTPILITVGEQDFRVPMNNAIMFFAVQQRLQTPSKLVIFPEENHWIRKGENSRFWFSEVHAWLAKYLR
jgi:dipeptidyl aminopeptidase/acylaminoacyl peptidase